MIVYLVECHQRKVVKCLKKVLLLCLIFSIILSVVPTISFADYSLPQYIRVGLMYGNGVVKTLTLESESGFILGDYQDRELVRVDTTSETTVIVKVDGNVLSVYDSQENVIYMVTIWFIPEALGQIPTLSAPI